MRSSAFVSVFKIFLYYFSIRKRLLEITTLNMFHSLSKLYIYIVALVILLSSVALAEPVQYCQFGSYAENGAPETADFCVGMLMHHNLSSNAHDLYLSMTVGRSSNLGWNAIGTGQVMAGSLMFIIYGDPESQHSPIVSIRTVDGHHQPKLVTKGDMGGADLRVLQSRWMPNLDVSSRNSARSIAKVSLVCYSCHEFPGSAISASATSQPWIWAWNDKQEFPVYSYDAHLDMHKHHAGNGGWGNFYADMSLSINEWKGIPSLPPIRKNVATVGTSDSPIGPAGLLLWLRNKPIVHLHGFIMGIVFFVLLPLGVFFMRAKSSKSFKYHWIIQLAASVLTLVGTTIGIEMGGKINTAHQWAGCVLTLILGIQGVLGWRHHVRFLQIKQRTWISYFHIWLGRGFLIAGWVNFLGGMSLAGHNRVWVILVGALVVIGVLTLSVCVWTSHLRHFRKGKDDTEKDSYGEWPRGRTGSFVVGDDEDESEEPEPNEGKNSERVAMLKDPGS